MFQTLNNDWHNLSKERFAAKYLLIGIIFLLSVAIIGQIIAQLFTVNQFEKVTDKIVSKEVVVSGYSGGGRSSKGEPEYSIILLLDNNQTYTVDLANENDWRLDSILRKDDLVTVYNPSSVYQIFSLDRLDFGSRVSQVESQGQVLYDFKDHQQHAWKFIAFLVAALGLFSYLLYDWHR